MQLIFSPAKCAKKVKADVQMPWTLNEKFPFSSGLKGVIWLTLGPQPLTYSMMREFNNIKKPFNETRIKV